MVCLARNIDKGAGEGKRREKRKNVENAERKCTGR